MNKMKKIILVTVVIISVFSFVKFQNNILTFPDYPLDINEVELALEASGIPWTVKQDNPVVEGQTVYSLSKDGKLIGGVISGLKDGETFLNVTAALYYNNGYSLPKSEWENFIVFATILNGGFKNKHQIYDVFSKEYDTVNTTKFSRKNVPRTQHSIDETSLWKNKIRDYYVQISLTKPDINYSEEYLNVIIISTNLDAFLS